MPLPALGADGLLPPGPHDATNSEVADLFARGCRFRSRDRGLAWAAYLVWAERVRLHFGPSWVWLTGGFFTHQNVTPVIRALVFPRTPSMVRRTLDGGLGFSLLTIEDVIYSSPEGGWTPRVVPVGGWVDAALGNILDVGAAELLWSLGLGIDGTWSDTEAGYVRLEV